MNLADLIWLGQRLVDTGRLDAQARARGVPPAEFVVMRSLIEQAPSTISALTAQTGYAQSRVSTAVAGLVERGWVLTGPDPGDGRRTLVSVPDRIRQAADDILTGTKTNTLDHLLSHLAPERREVIVDALEELLTELRRQAADPLSE